MILIFLNNEKENKESSTFYVQSSRLKDQGIRLKAED
jgi:hypothetical protein